MTLRFAQNIISTWRRVHHGYYNCHMGIVFQVVTSNLQAAVLYDLTYVRAKQRSFTAEKCLKTFGQDSANIFTDWRFCHISFYGPDSYHGLSRRQQRRSLFEALYRHR